MHAFGRYGTRFYHLVDNDLDFDPDYTARRYGLGGGAGYKHVFNAGLVLEIYLGFGYALGVWEDYYTPDRANEVPVVDWSNVLQLGKLGIGYRF